jgi:hypothetical protein
MPIHPLTHPAGCRRATRQNELPTQSVSVTSRHPTWSRDPSRHFPSGPFASSSMLRPQRVASRHHPSPRHRHHAHRLSISTATLPCFGVAPKTRHEHWNREIEHIGTERFRHIGTGIPNPSPANFLVNQVGSLREGHSVGVFCVGFIGFVVLVVS